MATASERNEQLETHINRLMEMMQNLVSITERSVTTQATTVQILQQMMAPADIRRANNDASASAIYQQ